jgi:hypothetical protein
MIAGFAARTQGGLGGEKLRVLHRHCDVASPCAEFRRRRFSIQELDADRIVVAPDQAALADGTKIVERKIEAGRHDIETAQPNAGAMVGDVAYLAFKDAVSPDEEE